MTALLPRFFKRFVLPHWPIYCAGLFFLVLTTWVMIQIPKVMGVMIDQLGWANMTAVQIRPTVLKLMGLSGFLILFRSLSRVILFYPGRVVERDLRTAFLDRLVWTPFANRLPLEIGDLMSRGVNDISSVRVMVSMGILHIVNSVALFIGAMQGMWSLSPALMLWVMLPLTAMFVATMFAVQFIYVFVRQAQERLGDLSESTRENLKNYSVFNIFPVRGAILERFEQANHAYSAAVLRATAARACFFPLMTAFIGLGALIVLLKGGEMVIAGELPLGHIVAFIAYIWILSDPAVAIGWMVNALQRGHSALARIYEILDQDEMAVSSVVVPPVQQLEVSGLKFSHPAKPEKNPFMLQLEHLALERGKLLGVFGPTGSGKSTLAQWLAGLHSVQPGQLLVDGVDRIKISAWDWAKQVSLVPQQTLLFAGTLKDNIVMGAPLDEARLHHVMEQAQLNQEVAQFPAGVETQVGETGIALSGGQRQRVSLARALYHDAPILILDDMTSAVDVVTESALLTTLQEIAKQRAVMVISHRVSTLQACQEILIVEEGRVTARGSHEALLKASDLYRATAAYEADAMRKGDSA